jgi:2-phospho-L-lactate guanylyltransferase
MRRGGTTARMSAADRLPAPQADIWAIVPVKRLRLAKSRLKPALGRAVPGFARFLACHVLDMLSRSSRIAGILVLTSDTVIARDATRYGAWVVDDEGAGLNAACRIGLLAARARGGARALILPADLPLLEPTSIDRLIARAEDGAARGTRIGLVRSKDGDGTNAVLCDLSASFLPCFGPGSFEHHMSQGAIEIEGTEIGFDVDNPSDLTGLLHRARWRSGS